RGPWMRWRSRRAPVSRISPGSSLTGISMSCGASRASRFWSRGWDLRGSEVDADSKPGAHGRLLARHLTVGRVSGGTCRVRWRLSALRLELKGDAESRCHRRLVLYDRTVVGVRARLVAVRIQARIVQLLVVDG